LGGFVERGGAGIAAAVVLSAVAALLAQEARAATVLMPPAIPIEEQKKADAARPGKTEDFPDSAFGRPPARVETGLKPGDASASVDDVDSDRQLPGRSRLTADGPEYLNRSIASAPAEAAAPAANADVNRTPSSIPVPSDPARGGGTATVATGAMPRLSELELQAARRKGVQEVAVIANETGYFPKTLFVNRDVPVRLYVTGASKNTLCLMMDSFQVRKQVKSQKVEEITFVPTLAGKYRFYCPVNGMEGTLVVRELVTQAE